MKLFALLLLIASTNWTVKDQAEVIVAPGAPALIPVSGTRGDPVRLEVNSVSVVYFGIAPDGYSEATTCQRVRTTRAAAECTLPSNNSVIRIEDARTGPPIRQNRVVVTLFIPGD